MKKLWEKARLSDKILVGLLAAVIMGWSATTIHAQTNRNRTQESANLAPIVKAPTHVTETTNATSEVVINSNSTGDLTSEEAIEIAHEYLISKGMTNATFVYSDSDIDNGIPVWSIEFGYNDRNLEFYVEKATGNLLKHPTISATHTNNDNTINNDNNTLTPANTEISRDRAIEIAYEYLSAEGYPHATFNHDSSMDWEHGRLVWELEFRDGRTVIEFYIDVNDGSVVKFEVDWD